jgi:YHS domain-containing protein
MSALAVVAFVAATFFLNSLQKTRAADGKILYYTCFMHPSVKTNEPGSCPICGMGLEPVYASDDATNNPPSSTTGTNSPAAQEAKPYPFDTCLVDGMKLGSMGDPYVFVYQGQVIKFCCADCKPAFLKDAEKYMKKIQDAEVAAKK